MRPLLARPVGPPVVGQLMLLLESLRAEVALVRPLVGVGSHVVLEALAGGEDELADFTGVGATAPPAAAARRLRLFTARGVKRC